jgi:V8-like Glu-specific endopeptidase
MFPTKNTRRQRAFWINAAAAFTAACSLPVSLPAGTIRHDRDDRVYQMMAQKEGWQAVGQMGQILPDGQFFGRCTLTLIDEQWVLCAAHCINSFDPFTGVYEEFPPPLVRIGTQFVQLTPADVFVHPGWIQGGANIASGGYDIALFRLPAPLDRERRRPRPQGRQPVTRQPVDPGRAIIPLRINTKRTEVGQRATSVGFGGTGTGLTGEVLRTSDLRAGVNTIDATAVTLKARSPRSLPRTIGNERMLLTDFDSPLTPAMNVVGLAEPLNYEYTTARGDSGGPLILPNGEIAGICSGGLHPLGFNLSAYGDLAIFTRVSSYRDWITSVKAGKEPSLAVMIPRLRANGFFPGQPFRGVVTPAMRQAREEFFQVIAAGWVPTLRSGRTLAGTYHGQRNFRFPAPFRHRESNPLKPTPMTKPIAPLLTEGQRVSVVSGASEFPISIECLSCGLSQAPEGPQAAWNSPVMDSTETEGTLQSVLVSPR